MRAGIQMPAIAYFDRGSEAVSQLINHQYKMAGNTDVAFNNCYRDLEKARRFSATVAVEGVLGRIQGCFGWVRIPWNGRINIPNPPPPANKGHPDISS
jgi:hypothetical protein